MNNDRLMAWCRGNKERRLSVAVYRDRRIGELWAIIDGQRPPLLDARLTRASDEQPFKDEL
jgi:hypothetical protein